MTPLALSMAHLNSKAGNLKENVGIKSKRLRPADGQEHGIKPSQAVQTIVVRLKFKLPY